MPDKNSASDYPDSSNPFAPFFEEESHGSAALEMLLSAATSSVIDSTRNEGRFSGVLRIMDGRVVLNSGGMQAEILIAEAPPTAAALGEERQRAVHYFAASDGKDVYLKGEQQNGYILSARYAARGVRAATSLDEATRHTFSRIVEVIKDHHKELYRPGVIDIRPGYRFTDGLITDEPVIVVVVDRKLEQSSLSPRDRIPPSIEGISIDVAPATPLEQLRHRMRDEEMVEGEAGSIAPLLADEPQIALPFSESFTDEEALSRAFEALADIHYTPPSDVHLDEVTAAMTVICHVSPDAGWTTLKGEFFDKTSDRITIAMYDFTAPHILRGLRSAMGHARGTLKLILGPGASLGKGTKEGDLDEDTIIERLSRGLRRRFHQVWAVVRGPERIFANSYHIKVAVRDGRSFWLSSGNWQSSNQPDLDPLGSDANYPDILREYNREWNVIVNHPGLAEMFEKFIEWDIQHGSRRRERPEGFEVMPEFFVTEDVETDIASAERLAPRYFPPAKFQFTHDNPLRVQPLLTPDNYAEKILPLIQSAEEKLYFQNQSLSILENNAEAFDALIDALRDKSMERDMDVRIILRGEYNARRTLEAMKARGFNTARIRFQDRCHTKGIVVDSKIAVVSSHNWTNSGTLYNRDAGLIFYDSRIARYYEDIFLYDWENLARRQVRAEETMPVLAEPDAPTPPGKVRVSLADIFED